jgi:hypothetical protein
MVCLVQPRLARNRFRSGTRPDPCISSVSYCDHDYYFELLHEEERDAQSITRCSTAHHGDFRALPRANRTFSTAHNPIACASSSKGELPVCVPWLPNQCHSFSSFSTRNVNIRCKRLLKCVAGAGLTVCTRNGHERGWAEENLQRLSDYRRYATSNSARSHFPVVAPASYVLCKNSSNAPVGDFALLTSSYIRRYSPMLEW